MMAIRTFVWAIALPMLLAAPVPRCALSEEAAGDAAEMNRRLGRGINLGNMLEAPREGAWGLKLDERYFKLIAEAGFDSARIPIRWSAHAAEDPPYEVDADFFERVDRAVEAALAENLTVVLNVHHYDELYENPPEQRDRFLALWQQIASRYQDQPPELYFELLNEPHGNLDAVAWNELLADALGVVRRTNPERIVIIGPAQWNNYGALGSLELPKEDPRLIVTFHYYLPFRFTHQGASWAEGSDEWLGTTWTGTEEERHMLRTHLDRAHRWAEEHGRPLYLGEFGAYSRADIESRVRWTEFVRSEAERRGMSWAYWEFGSGFGAYDPQRELWRQRLLSALVPREQEASD